MSDLERLHEQLRETLEMIATSRKLAGDNPRSQAHALTLRSLGKRQRSLEDRIAKFEAMAVPTV